MKLALTTSGETLDAPLEKAIAESIQNSKQGIISILPPEVAQGIINVVSEAVNEMIMAGHNQVILTSPNIRLAFRRLISAALPKVAVISFNEIMPDVEVEGMKTVRYADGD